MGRILAVLVTVIGCVATSDASDPPWPTATLELSHPVETLAFISNTSIAGALCQRTPVTSCSLSVIRWEGGVLRPYVATSYPGLGMTIHPSSGGRILTTPEGLSPAVLFSSDLSLAQELPPLHLVSQSGNTAAESTQSGWKIYQFKPQLELVRIGTGDLKAISDQIVVVREDDVIRTEKIDGKLLGSFFVPPEKKCTSDVWLVSDDSLYLNDCKLARLVDLNGREQSKVRLPRRSDYKSRSDDGKRILFDRFDRKISIFRNAGEIFVALATLGMGVSNEENNGEEVKVVDTANGHFCFDWHQSFPEGSGAVSRNAAISPSGEFVAIAAHGTLSIYRLPAVCEGRK